MPKNGRNYDTSALFGYIITNNRAKVKGYIKINNKNFALFCGLAAPSRRVHKTGVFSCSRGGFCTEDFLRCYTLLEINLQNGNIFM